MICDLNRLAIQQHTLKDFFYMPPNEFISRSVQVICGSTYRQSIESSDPFVETVAAMNSVGNQKAEIRVKGDRAAIEELVVQWAQSNSIVL